MAVYRWPGSPLAEADDFYLAATAYQVVLACLMSANAPQRRAVLVIKQRLKAGADALVAALRADTQSPWCDVRLLRRPARYKRRQRAFSDRRRRPELISLFDEANPERLFVFNEDPLDQTLIRRMARRGGEIHAIEDGAIAYANVTRHITSFEAWRNRFWFGYRTHPVTIEGRNTLFSAFHAVFPEAVRPALAGQTLRAVPGVRPDAVAAFRWPRDYAQRLGSNPDRLCCTGLVALARTTNAVDRPDHARRMGKALDCLIARGGEWAISYHPDEKRRDPLGAVDRGFTLIDHRLPIEMVYSLAGRRLRTVVGDLGTALMTARWLAPQARTISLMRYLELIDQQFQNALIAIDVSCPNTLPELNACLDAAR